MKRICTSQRLAKLRDLLQAKQLQAYLLPSEDEHFNEYVDASDQRCAFISGFTGSVCRIVVTLDKAALWTDGRYHLQASQQLDENWSVMRKDLVGTPSEAKWLVNYTPPGSKIGYDARQIPFHEVRSYLRELAEAEAVMGILPTHSHMKNPLSRQLVEIEPPNLADIVWDSMSASQIEGCSRPSRLANPLIILPNSFTGLTWQQKLNYVRNLMSEKYVNKLILSALDEIAWLFNLRGSDINFNPLFFAYAIIHMDNVDLFLHPRTVSSTPHLKDYLTDETYKVEIHDYSKFFDFLELSIQNVSSSSKSNRIWLDVLANQAMISKIPKHLRFIYPSPIADLKCIKSKCELEGIRYTHIIDSLTLCDFLAWLENISQINENSSQSNILLKSNPIVDGAGLPIIKPPTELTEYTLAQYLDKLRSQTKSFISPSFATISCIDSNGALVHYNPVMGQDLPLTSSSMYLIDSGGHYMTGTTDVTRTIHLGQPSVEQINCYTIVLKAHIALAMQVFPSNTPGSRLDVIARKTIWQYKRDYAHGTGHGVGAFLGVHEGPIGLSGTRCKFFSHLGISEPGIRENMVVTIEPGYYLPDHFGIRLENVVFVVPFDSTSSSSSDTINLLPDPNFSQTSWLTFEPVTLVPFQRHLINVDLLSEDELQWLNQYHNKVRQVLLCHILNEAGMTDTFVHDSPPQSLSSSRKRCYSWILKHTESLHK